MTGFSVASCNIILTTAKRKTPLYRRFMHPPRIFHEWTLSYWVYMHLHGLNSSRLNFAVKGWLFAMDWRFVPIQWTISTRYWCYILMLLTFELYILLGHRKPVNFFGKLFYDDLYFKWHIFGIYSSILKIFFFCVVYICLISAQPWCLKLLHCIFKTASKVYL